MTATPNTGRPSTVSPQDFEASLSLAALQIADPNVGLFGPGSLHWRLNRESAVFLGAGRAALLQLAHPWVAVSLEQHSSLLNDPIARFHNTFRIIFTMIFGTAPQAFSAARSLYDLHTHIGGQLPQPVASYAHNSRYEANHIPALRWVYATLVDSARLAYECVLPPFAAPELEAYYADSKVLASLFGIPAAALPSNWAAFTAYFEEMCSSNALGVDHRARATAHSLLAGAGSWIHPPFWYRSLTAAWMPPRFRDEFQLSFGPHELRAAQNAHRWLPRVYRRLPATLRFSGPYQEACARLARRAPGPLIRASNRFWIGQPRLPFGG